VQLKPFHTGPLVPFVLDEWSLSHAALPPAINYNDTISIDLHLIPPSTQSFDSYAFGYTNETAKMLSPSLESSHTLADLNLGKALKVSWALPLSYPLTEIRLKGMACGSTQTQEFESKPIKLNSTSATITFPKTVNGESTIGASLNLSFQGPRGQRSKVLYGVSTCF
jgi:hypothetical protein